MGSFKGFVVKEFKQIYRDKRTLIVLFGMPVIMMVLFGFAIRNEIVEAQIAVLDYSKESMTARLIQKIDASSSVKVAGVLSTEKEIKPLFQQGDVKAVLVIPPRFGEKLHKDGRVELQMISDATDPNLANLLQGYVGRFAADYSREVMGGAEIGLTGLTA
jgi:ABC-2 type transport system permease protein